MPANVNTGKKDTKGRTIFKGPRGGLFVRVDGKKQKPATGRAAPAARSPARSPARAPARAPKAKAAWRRTEDFVQLLALSSALLETNSPQTRTARIQYEGKPYEVKVFYEPAPGSYREAAYGRRISFQIKSGSVESELYVVLVQRATIRPKDNGDYGVVYYLDRTKEEDRSHDAATSRLFDKIFKSVVLTGVLGRWGQTKPIKNLERWEKTLDTKAKKNPALLALMKKNRPAAAPAARSPARSPARAPAATGNVNTGQVDGEGRTIFRGPRGGLFVRVNGKKQKPAVGSPPTAHRLMLMREKAEEKALKEAYGTPKIFGRKKTGRFLNAAGTAAVLATFPPEEQCPPGKVYNPPESEHDPRGGRCISLSSTTGQRELLRRAKIIEQERHREGKTYVRESRVNGRYIPGHYA